MASINKFEFKSKNSVIKNINVFVFYVDSKSSKFFYQRKADIGFKYFNELEMLVTFCQHINENFKNLNIILCTDKKTFIPNNLVINIIRLNFDQNLPMYSRNMLMKLYVRSKHFYQNTIFLDWDIILNFDLDEIFENYNFDIGLTRRSDNKMMPINEGVIFAKYNRKNKVVSFFNKLNSIYVNFASNRILKFVYGNIKQWRGGQLSLAKIIQWKNTQNKLIINENEYLILDTLIYNFTSINDISENDLRLKKIVHLKGWVKNYMYEIYKVLNKK